MHPRALVTGQCVKMVAVQQAPAVAIPPATRPVFVKRAQGLLRACACLKATAIPEICHGSVRSFPGPLRLGLKYVAVVWGAAEGAHGCARYQRMSNELRRVQALANNHRAAPSCEWVGRNAIPTRGHVAWMTTSLAQISEVCSWHREPGRVWVGRNGIPTYKPNHRKRRAPCRKRNTTIDPPKRRPPPCDWMVWVRGRGPARVAAALRRGSVSPMATITLLNASSPGLVQRARAYHRAVGSISYRLDC